MEGHPTRSRRTTDGHRRSSPCDNGRGGTRRHRSINRGRRTSGLRIGIDGGRGCCCGGGSRGSRGGSC